MSNEEVIDSDIRRCIEALLQDYKISEYDLNVVHDENKVLTYTSNIYQINIIYKDNKKNSSEMKTLHFFIKQSTKGESCKKYLAVHEMYQREIYFYREVVPLFTLLQENRAVLNKLESYPNFYKSSDNNLKEVIILDNLIDKGFKKYQKSLDVDIAHALLVMKELGRFHALSFGIRDQAPHMFRKMYNNLNDIEYHGMTGKTSEAFINRGYPSFIKALNSDNYRYANAVTKLEGIKDSLFKTVQKAVEKETAEPYSVVNHGDLWTPNLLFKYNKKSCPTKACLVDYQNSRMCSPAVDISQFIFVCLNGEDRNKHYKQLIDEYYKSFSTLLQELGSKPELLFPYAILEDHLKRFSIVGFTLALKICCLYTISPEDSPDLEKIQDSDSCARIFCDAKKNLSLYNQYVRDIILDYIELGYNL